MVILRVTSSLEEQEELRALLVVMRVCVANTKFYSFKKKKKTTKFYCSVDERFCRGNNLNKGFEIH